jgi:nicotinamidase-related amidase
LLLIDFQREYRDGELPLPDINAAVVQAQRLRAAARQRGWPVVHVRQLAASPQAPLFAPGAPGSEFLPELQPAAGEDCVDKRLPSAFAGTELAGLLAGRGITCLLIAGLMTHNCVDATARDAFHRGFRVVIAGDACATRDLPDAAGVVPAPLLQRAVLAGLADRIAEVGDVAALLQAAG